MPKILNSIVHICYITIKQLLCFWLEVAGKQHILFLPKIWRNDASTILRENNFQSGILYPTRQSNVKVE